MDCHVSINVLNYGKIKGGIVMKTVAVTGASGRLGSWLVRDMLAKGYPVIAIDQHQMDLADCKCLQVNLANFGEVESALHGADAVIHLAAIPAPRGFTNEVIFASNVVTTYHVLEAASILGISNVVTASSESSYGYAWAENPFRHHYFPVDESYPQLPQECYGLSKIVNEATGAMFHRRNGTQITSMRFSMIVSPEAYKQMNSSISNPDAYKHILWSYIDIRDAAAACMAAVEKDDLGYEDFNITADDTISNWDTRRLMTTFYPEIDDIRDGLEGRKALVSNEKAKKLLGWRPKHSWQQEI
jgi:nucleoside-diphosphate-sugar epimerase